MTTQDKKEIRGITLSMVWTFILGTITVCGTIIGGVAHIEKTFSNHEVRISNNERDISDIKTLFITQNLKRR